MSVLPVTGYRCNACKNVGMYPGKLLQLSCEKCGNNMLPFDVVDDIYDSLKELYTRIETLESKNKEVKE